MKRFGMREREKKKGDKPRKHSRIVNKHEEKRQN
jgi:hypothetical protein